LLIRLDVKKIEDNALHKGSVIKSLSLTSTLPLLLTWPGVKKATRHEKSSAYLDVRKTLDKIKRGWEQAKPQSTPTDTKISQTGKSEFEAVEGSEGDEKPAPKTNDPFLFLRKFPRLASAKRGRGSGPHKWFSR